MAPRVTADGATAPGHVTKRPYLRLTFAARMSMRAVACRLATGGIVLAAAVAAAALATLAPNVRHAALAGSCPASGPPCPANAFLTLGASAGGPDTSIAVSGGSFLPGESMSIYWDTPSKVIGSATADGHGNFSNVKVKPFAGEKPGSHQICASVPPQPCATFLLQGTPTPTPSSAAAPSESPSPEVSPSPTESPTPIPIPGGSTNGLDLILKPPLVFLPLAGLVGVVLAIGWWLFSSFPRRQRALPSASISHRSTRPTWTPPTETAFDTAGPIPEAARPPWPAVPPPPPQPHESPPSQEWEERTPWPAPRPPQPDEPDDEPRVPESES